VIGSLEAIEEVHVHLHLPQVLVRELAELEIHQHEAAQQAVVEDQVDIEVIAVEGEPLLARHEAEALAQLQQERLDAVDDRLLQLALSPLRSLVEPQELEHERLLDHVRGMFELVPSACQRHHLLLVAALRQPLEQERGNLPLQLATRPAVPRRLDLVERSRRRVRDLHEDEVVGPSEVGWERRGGGRFGQRCCPNRWPVESGQRCCPNRRSLRRQHRARRVRLVEQAETPQRSGAKASADPADESRRQPVDDLVAIAGALGAGLLDLDDLAPDHPVRMHHRRVDRPRRVVSSGVDDLEHAREQRRLTARW